MRRAGTPLALAILCFLASSQDVRASSAGIVGYSGQQGAYCTQCHSVGAGSVPTVSITGPTSLAAGATGNYTFTVTGGPGVRAGIDISADSVAATLQAVTANTRNTAGEIHHSTPLTFSGGSVAVQFRMVAPPTSGIVKLFAAGNSTNGGGNTGDRSAITSLSVNVTGGINQAPSLATPAAASMSPVTGLTTNLSVLGADDSGEAGLTYTWSATAAPSAVTFSANGTNGAKNTVATFSAAGSYVFNVVIKDAANLTTNSTVSVTVNAVVSTIVVTPGSASIAAGATQQFTAVAKNQFGATVAPQPTYGWSTTGGGSVNINGLFTAGTVLGGPNAVTAAGGGRTGSASVTITGTSNQPPTVASAPAASPATVTATTTALTALGADDNGEAALTYTWTATTAPAAVGFSANGTNAAKSTTATFLKAGVYTFTVVIRDAASAMVSSVINVTVNATLSAVTVTPASATVNPAATQQFTATARDQFATSFASQPTFTWTTTGGGTLSAAGLFTAAATAGGPFTITAAASAMSGTASVSVNATPGNPPTVATAAAATPAVVTAKTASLSVLGADDGGEANLVYTWAATTAPAAVTFSANGTNAARTTVATFGKAGTYVFAVTIKDLNNTTATSTVSVTVNPTSTTVAVSPAAAGVSLSGTQQFAAAASDQFALAIVPAPLFTWTASGGGTLNASGLFTAANAAGGPFTITASAAGKSGTASVTVSAGTPPTLAQPATANPAVVNGSTTSLSVLGADNGGETALVYSWVMTSGPAAVTFSVNDSNGAKNTVATFGKSGAYKLTVRVKDATNLTVFSAVDVTVTQTLTTLAVSPTNASVPVSTALQFSATGADQFANPMASAPLVTWLASGGGTVSASGLFTAGTQAGGPFSLMASVGAVNATVQVTVTGGSGIPDTTPPQVALLTPSSGQTLTGSVALEASASDGVGVVEVQFKIDGATVGTSAGPAWKVTVDSRQLTDGAHQLEAIGRDAAGNLGRSGAITVQVDNKPPVVVTPPRTGCSSGGASLAAFGLLSLLGLARRRRSTHNNA